MTFAQAVHKATERARLLHPKPYNSYHEALAVLWEEFEELKTEVFLRTIAPERIMAELLDCAAVIQRFAEDLVEPRLHAVRMANAERMAP